MENGTLQELLTLFEEEEHRSGDGDAEGPERSMSVASKLAVLPEIPTNIIVGKNLLLLCDWPPGLLFCEDPLPCAYNVVPKSPGHSTQTRRLVPIDFDCPANNDENAPGEIVSSALMHTGDTSSSEDEYERNHDEHSGLTAYGRAIKRELAWAAKNKCECRPEDSKIKKKLEQRANRVALQEKAQQTAKVLEASAKDACSVYDSYFAIRIKNPRLPVESFRIFTDGIRKIRVSQLKPCAHDNDDVQNVLVAFLVCLQMKPVIISDKFE
ncbi:unnamed protein product [Gongylonema pulchrum]|uniref:Uncharacterized protein n=1 Tax=Gongylonema pulchrum TaxID=637853 RepID=A0A183E3M4_9BILA|nr:unnamed protein product [Gongylonema pulchrum]